MSRDINLQTLTIKCGDAKTVCISLDELIHFFLIESEVVTSQECKSLLTEYMHNFIKVNAKHMKD